MRAAIVLTICGCNQVFGLQRTQQATPSDAQFFDAPLDAAYTCPPIGTAPQFSPMLHQVIDQSCYEYIPSPAGFAIGQCYDFLGYGPVDQPLTLAVGLQSDASATIDQVRLAPSGDVAYARFHLPMAGFFEYFEYQLSGGTWTSGTSLPFGGLAQSGLSSVARGPSGNRLLVTEGSVIHEWAEDSAAASGWSEILPSYSLSELQISSPPGFIGLTSDGLRIVFQSSLAVDPTSQPQELYADRATLTDRFTNVQPLPGIPLVYNAYMTADCRRVYLTGLDTVFYAYGRSP